ncbi:semaphorin-3B [Callorhinchus milii]|uniref:Semaphorin-3B n=1 Tax=Callorhinchus milii TaxID=7868 RepID=V9KCL1_CALMI|nr:semaphorin-3B [Callorhinchus milii]XP_007888496.2 semaphorin-3B [Callorhinchus milii]XP_007888498.2 semaphorin-3B [Callorhinchus milii]
MALLWNWVLIQLVAVNAFHGKTKGLNPRLKMSYNDLTSRGLVTYQLNHSCCYNTLLMDEERGRLFVGAKDYLISLSLDNINNQERKINWPAPVEWREECNWAGKDLHAECANFVKVLHLFNRTHLYTCGTGAFHPTCAYLEVGNRINEHLFRIDQIEDGKGRSPYDAKHLSTSILIGEELYSGVATDLMGRDFTIFRSLGHRHSIRTEQHDSRWLNDPKFIGAFWIPESDNPDDDKIYFFFRETAVEGQNFGKSTFSRVGQICRNDYGGQRSLVNKWTTFLKARLICSVPGNEGIDTHFDELRDVFLLQTRDPRNPLVYTVFGTSSNVFRGSAVCVYSINDIRRAFLGPFAHKEGPNYQWIPYQGKVPYPRPGMCPSKTFGNFQSTKEFPDDVVLFARNHPLMYNPIYPINTRPLLIKTNVDYSFTQIVVDRVDASDGRYDVMFIGTDVGTVWKVISVPKESWQNMEELLLEELQVFKDSAPITNMELSSKRQQLYIGSDTAISQLPLQRCSIYGKACAECCLARDPYCAWDGNTCTRYLANTKRRFRRQDVRNGDPNTLCSGDRHRQNTIEKHQYGVEGSSTFLECVPKSLQAQVTWTHQRHSNARRDEVHTDNQVIKTQRGLLLRNVQRRNAGVYLCHTVEHGFSQTLMSFSLEVIGLEQADELVRREGPGPGPRGNPSSSSQKVWYRDFLQLIDHPNLRKVDEVCEQVWQRRAGKVKHRRAPARKLHTKWKHPQEVRRGRNRRTHDVARADRAPRSAVV